MSRRSEVALESVNLSEDEDELEAFLSDQLPKPSVSKGSPLTSKEIPPVSYNPSLSSPPSSSSGLEPSAKSTWVYCCIAETHHSNEILWYSHLFVSVSLYLFLKFIHVPRTKGQIDCECAGSKVYPILAIKLAIPIDNFSGVYIQPNSQNLVRGYKFSRKNRGKIQSLGQKRGDKGKKES